MADNNYKGKKRSGTLFRRRGGRRYDLDDPSAKDATIYLRYKVDGKTHTKSLQTTDPAVADRKREEIMGPLRVTDKTKYLHHIQSMLTENEEQENRLAEQNASYLTLEAAWDSYTSPEHAPECGTETLNRYSSHFKALKKWLGKKHPTITKLNEVDKKVATEFATHIGRNFSPNTYNKYRNFLISFYDELAEPAGISENPWRSIKRKKLTGKTNSKRELTFKELKEILQKAEGEEFVLHALGIFTGMRLGDCATLRWSEVDLDRKIIIRIPNKTKHSSGKKVKIGIPPPLLIILSQSPESKRRGYVLPNTQKQYVADHTVISRQINDLFKKCSIDTIKPGTGKGTKKRAIVEVGFHSYRHTYVSLNIMAGIPMAHVQQLVGHKNPSMTEHYAHFSDTAAIQYAQALPDPTAKDNEDVPTADFEEIDPPIPKWVIDKIEAQTSKNWKSIQSELIERYRSACNE